MKDRIPSFGDLDVAEPIRTRDGRAARLMPKEHPQRMGPYTYPLVAEVEHPNKAGAWVRWHYLRCGHWKSNDACNGNDLVNVRCAGMH